MSSTSLAGPTTDKPSKKTTQWVQVTHIVVVELHERGERLVACIALQAWSMVTIDHNGLVQCVDLCGQRGMLQHGRRYIFGPGCVCPEALHVIINAFHTFGHFGIRFFVLRGGLKQADGSCHVGHESVKPSGGGGGGGDVYENSTNVRIFKTTVPNVVTN